MKYLANFLVFALILLVIANTYYVWDTPYFWRDVIFGGVSSLLGIISILWGSRIIDDGMVRRSKFYKVALKESLESYKSLDLTELFVELDFWNYRYLITPNKRHVAVPRLDALKHLIEENKRAGGRE